jgi:flagellar biosynthesis protein FlhG
MIAVAGGKGGVGKSTVAVNLALAIGRLGYRAALVDADLGAANLHTMVGVLHPPSGLADFLDERVGSLDDVAMQIAPLVSLVPGVSRPGAADLVGVEKIRLIRAIADLEVDVVVVDVGAGTGSCVLDLIGIADHKVIVLAPQLTSLHNAYALLKACVHRTVRRISADEVHQSLVDAALGGEAKSRTIAQLLNVVRPFDAVLADRVLETLARYGVGLVANQVSTDGEAFALARMSQLIRDHLSIGAPLLAAIRRSPTLAGSLRAGDGTVAGRNDDSRASFLQLARSLVDVDLGKLRLAMGSSPPPTQPHKQPLVRAASGGSEHRTKC